MSNHNKQSYISQISLLHDHRDRKIAYLEYERVGLVGEVWKQLKENEQLRHRIKKLEQLNK